MGAVSATFSRYTFATFPARRIVTDKTSAKSTAMSNSKTSILIVDPVRLFCRGLAHLLSESGYDVSWSDPAESLTTGAETSLSKQDILIIGHNLRSCDAFNLGRWALERRPNLKVILFLCEADNPFFQSDAVAAGFSACLSHTATESQVLTTVSGVLAGGLMFSRDVIALAQQPLDLTRAELDVLQLLTERKSNEEIAVSLRVKVNTVKTHIKHIFEKLHVNNREDALKRACYRGLVNLPRA